MSEVLAGKRVLVVEDEYFIAADLKRALTSEEAIVVGPVAALEKGVSMVEKEKVDAAILDINLDGSFSYPLADKLSDRAVPFLIVTGYDGSALPERYRDAPRVSKPFDPREVVAMLESLCREADTT
jgi:DNA-binding response OmpR family regulator